MQNKKSSIKDRWNRLKTYLKKHTSLTVIIAAAIFLEITTAVMYYTAQNIVQQTLEWLVSSEINSLSLSVRNRLAKVETTIDNMAWVVTNDLSEPDSLLRATYQLVENNPEIHGSSISCIPYLYPKHGRWFESYAVRKADGTIESMQLGSANHDYTKSEYFTETIAKGTGYWCEPYLDSLGAKTMITTYGVPVRDGNGDIVAVIDADLSLEWLNEVINEERVYQSNQFFLLTSKYNMLAGEDSLLCKSLIEQIKVGSVVDGYGYFTLKDEYGKLMHAFYTPVKGKINWLIISIVDDDEVFGELRRVRLFLLLLILTGFLLIGFIVWRTSRNLERLRQVNAEKERFSSELHVASEIQQSMLPHNYLKKDNLEISGSLVPALEVGGDLFDYFIRDEKLFFCIGDVSGKGTPAAMFMASTRSLLRAFSAHENDPARIMNNVNKAACEGNDSCMFVTLFIGILDLPTGHLLYCNAGHDAPINITNGQWSQLETKNNLPIGAYEDEKYIAEETYLQSNSTLFLFTDGLTEAVNSDNKLFGLEQIETVIESCVDKYPKELLDTVTGAVHKFVGDAEQSDDLTMLAIRYTP